MSMSMSEQAVRGDRPGCDEGDESFSWDRAKQVIQNIS